MATQIPKPTMGESVGGLLSLFTGMMQTDVRPENAAASALPAAGSEPQKHRLPLLPPKEPELLRIVSNQLQHRRNTNRAHLGIVEHET